MDKLNLVAELRQASTKGAARKLRRDGKIPAVLYGEGEPRSLSIDERTWDLGFGHVSDNTIIELAIGKDKHQVLVKDSQHDIVNGRTKHIDFYVIHAGQVLHTHVPIHLEGSSPGVKEGGILEQKLESLDVACLPKDLPASVTVDISALEIGTSIHVGDLPALEGVEVKNDPSQTVVVVSHAKAAAIEEAEGEAEGEAAAEETEDEEDGAQE